MKPVIKKSEIDEMAQQNAKELADRGRWGRCYLCSSKVDLYHRDYRISDVNICGECRKRYL